MTLKLIFIIILTTFIIKAVGDDMEQERKTSIIIIVIIVYSISEYCYNYLTSFKPSPSWCSIPNPEW